MAASERTRADLLRFAIAFALRGARKLVRGLRHELSEEERFRVADDVVHRLQQHGDPWRLSEDLPPPGKGHSTRQTVRVSGTTALSDSCRDERIFMLEAKQREVAESVFDGIKGEKQKSITH